MTGRYRRSLRPRARFEKPPGTDWVVEIKHDGEGYPVTVYGAIDEDQAKLHALRSFGVREEDADHKVISVSRVE